MCETYCEIFIFLVSSDYSLPDRSVSQPVPAALHRSTGQLFFPVPCPTHIKQSQLSPTPQKFSRAWRFRGKQTHSTVRLSTRECCWTDGCYGVCGGMENMFSFLTFQVSPCFPTPKLPNPYSTTAHCRLYTLPEAHFGVFAEFAVRNMR